MMEVISHCHELQAFLLLPDTVLDSLNSYEHDDVYIFED